MCSRFIKRYLTSSDSTEEWEEEPLREEEQDEKEEEEMSGFIEETSKSGLLQITGRTA